MMSSQIRTMAAWTLAAMLLCAQFQIGESMKGSCLRKIGTQLNGEKASDCVTECATCGQNTNPYDSTIIITVGIGGLEFKFGTLIGKQLALTKNGDFWTRIFSPSDYNVYLTSNGIFDYSDMFKINSIIRGKKNDGDKIVLLKLNSEIPKYVHPACLPTSILTTTVGMEFDILVYTTAEKLFYKPKKGHEILEVYRPFNRKLNSLVNLPSRLINVKRKIICEEHDKSRLLTLDNAKKTKDTETGPIYKINYNGFAIHEVDGRSVLYGMLEKLPVQGNPRSNLRIVTIDDDNVVQWIHENAGEKCACEKPKAEVTPAMQKVH